MEDKEDLPELQTALADVGPEFSNGPKVSIKQLSCQYCEKQFGEFSSDFLFNADKSIKSSQFQISYCEIC